MVTDGLLEHERDRNTAGGSECSFANLLRSLTVAEPISNDPAESSKNSFGVIRMYFVHEKAENFGLCKGDKLVKKSFSSYDWRDR